jgi:hypothetical protein
VLLTHHAIGALICRAATESGIDPDRAKFLRNRADRPPPGLRPGFSLSRSNIRLVA